MSEYDANIALQRDVPTWQWPSRCDRKPAQCVNDAGRFWLLYLAILAVAVTAVAAQLGV
jgi:hypothetical protein